MRFMIPIEKCQTARGKKKIFVLVAKPCENQNMFYSVLHFMNQFTYYKMISVTFFKLLILSLEIGNKIHLEEMQIL